MKVFVFMACIFTGLSAFALESRQGLVKQNTPGSDTTVGYVTLMNTSEQAISVIAATSQVAEATELHQHLMKNDRMSMRKVDKITVKGQSELVFKTKGYHLMLINLTERLKPGETVPVTLTLDNGTTLEVELRVIESRPNYDSHSSHQNGHHH